LTPGQGLSVGLEGAKNAALNTNLGGAHCLSKKSPALAARLNTGFRLSIDRDAEIERLAADRTIFNVLLIAQGTVNQQIDSFAASWAVYGDGFQDIHFPGTANASRLIAGNARNHGYDERNLGK